jgi:acetyl esterase
MDHELDPQLEPLLAAFDTDEVPPLTALSGKAARAQFRDMAQYPAPDPEGMVQDIAIDGPNGDIPLRLYTPGDAGPHPILVFFHGGGFVLGDLDTHENICQTLSNRGNLLVVAVDYRLAPEHPFPKPLQDAYEATKWVQENADTFGGDPDHLAISGSSAGGNLAAAVSLLARDRDCPPIDHQILLYPYLNASGTMFEWPSHEENDGHIIDLDGLDWSANHYIQDEIHLRNQYASPILAHDVAGLPRTTIVTAGFDPLRDEGQEFAQRLSESGVETSNLHYPGMSHMFLSFLGMVNKADEAIDEILREIHDCYAGDGR